MGFQRAIGQVTKAFLGVTPTSVVAGGGSDNVDQAGPAIDRTNFLSAVISVPINATLSATKNVIVSQRLQHSADGSTGWTDFLLGAPSGANPAAQTYSTTGTSTQFQSANYDLSGAKRYIRQVLNAHHSNTTTDTTILAGQVMLGGENEPTL